MQRTNEPRWEPVQPTVPKRVPVLVPACHARSVSLLHNSSLRCRGSLGAGSVTRPHNSANSLRKPFKTPFKTPVENHRDHHVAIGNDRDGQSGRGIPSPPAENQHAQKDEESEDDVEIVEVSIKQEPEDDDAADDQSKPL